MHLLDIFHLNRVDSIYLGDQTLRILSKVVQVAGQGFLEHFLLACVHGLDQEALIE